MRVKHLDRPHQTPTGGTYTKMMVRGRLTLEQKIDRALRLHTGLQIDRDQVQELADVGKQIVRLKRLEAAVDAIGRLADIWAGSEELTAIREIVAEVSRDK